MKTITSIALVGLYITVSTLQAQTNLWQTTGNIGIGTTSPSYKFQVQKTNLADPAIMIGGGYYGGPRLQTYGLDADANAWMGLGTDMAGGPYEHSIYFSDYNGMGFLSFGTYNGSTYTEKMRLTRAGNVGIGTASPNAKLVVNGGAQNFKVNTWTNDIDVQITGGTYGYARSYRVGNSGESGNTQPYANFGAVGGNDGIDYAYIAIPAVSEDLVGYNSSKIMVLKASGSVGIGTTNPTEKLSVNGRIRAKEVIVETTGWSDHVFADSYQLCSLSEIEQHIKAEKHLPGVPSAQEVAEKGVSIGDMQAVLLAKIEELTLHQIEQEKELSSLRAEVNTLKAEKAQREQ